MNQYFQINVGQQEASDKILNMLIGEDRGFCLLGKAGTGKTHTLKHIITNVLPLANSFNKRHSIRGEWRFQLTGPTHKSVQILSDIQRSIDTKSAFAPRTLYSFLNLKPINEQGTTKIVKAGDFSNIFAEDYPLLLVIDEAGMLPKNVLEYLFKIAAQNSGMKFLFIYDHLQLSPPKSSQIPIHTYDIPSYELTQFMRSSNKHIDNINDYLRSTVESKTIPNVSDHCIGIDEFTKEVNSYFLKDTENSILVTYTNECTHVWNNHIHSLLTNYRAETDTRLLGEAYEFTKNEKKVVIPSDSSVVLFRDFISVGNTAINCDIVDPEVRRSTLSQLAAEAKKTKQWHDYYRYKERTPDLRLPYARTAYKTQGSTFDHVFVDLPNIMSCKIPDIRNRLLYVAVSRARKNLFILKE